MAFIPPQGNKTVMVDSSNNIVYPASFQKVVATQATIAGNNFTSVPSVIDPENATTTQLPSVASVVSYVSDVVEGGSSGLIPAIQSDIQTLGQVKSNRGELWFQNGGFAKVSNMSMNNSWSLCCRIRMQTAQVQNASIFHLGAFYLYWNTRLGVLCSPAIPNISQISVDDDNRLANGEWHTLVVSYNGTTLKLTDETGVLLSVATSEAISISGNLLIGEVNYNGQIADVKYFNFDMSADDAPYTIADYISGKDESPLLQTSQPVIEWTNNGAGTINGNSIEYNNAPSNVYPRPFGSSPVFNVGTTYEFKAIRSNSNSDFRLSSTINTSDSCDISWNRINLTTGNTFNGTSSKMRDLNVFGVGQVGEVETIVKFTPKVSGIVPFFAVDKGMSGSITIMYVHAYGALLSLDDYSIKVGATQIVPDVSGNNNDATITGEVYSSKDKSIAKMAQLFYQSQQG